MRRNQRLLLPHLLRKNQPQPQRQSLLPRLRRDQVVFPNLVLFLRRDLASRRGLPVQGQLPLRNDESHLHPRMSNHHRPLRLSLVLDEALLAVLSRNRLLLPPLSLLPRQPLK